MASKQQTRQSKSKLAVLKERSLQANKAAAYCGLINNINQER